MLDFERHILKRDLRLGRCLYEYQAIELECGGERKTNRNLLLRHFKGQPVLRDEDMLLRDDLYE
ncbi:MAG: hypothetical protein E8D50_03410 [Nitrospira sp.]|nr:MAG: hypothetical protein E8D50_03410 [Nitrospira sp.]